MKYSYFVLPALLCATVLSAPSEAMAQTAQQTQQERTIGVSGVVVDEQGQPMPGVAVYVKGTTTGVATDFEGKFSLNAAANAELQISFIGYETQTIAVNGMSNLGSINMQSGFTELDELVVVGYGTQKKSDVTGALVRVDAETLNQRPVSNAFEALQGKAAGVDITSNERPGSVGQIRIRGNRSLNASNEPLYVVDGVPLSAGGIESINPRDIESVDILKDASSTAIYGSRGANGVVLITTKHGHEGQMKVNYAGTWTIEKIKDLAPAFSASDYITWRRWAKYNSSPELYTPGDQPTKEQDQEFFEGDADALANVMKGWEGGQWDGSKVTNTDWTDFVTQTGLTQEHTLSASGGTDKIQAFASFGYLKNEGTQKGQEYERFNGALSLDLQAKDWFRMGGTANFSKSTQKYGWARGTYSFSGSGPVDIYSAAKDIPNYTVPYDKDGNVISTPGGSSVNRYSIIDEWKKSIDDRQTFRTLASIYAQIDFGGFASFLDGLSYKVSFGPDFRSYRQGKYTDSTSAGLGGGANKAERTDEQYFSWTLDNMLMYNKKIADIHSVGVTLLQSASKYNKENAKQSAQNIYMPSFKWNNMQSIDIADNETYKPGMSTGISQNAMSSYMARLNYSLMDRYLLTVSGRWDGASVLAEGNKWDFFPSAALGWRMEQEEFMSALDMVDQLKLRVGYGVTGNSSVNAYGTLGTVSSAWMPFSNGNEKILVYNEPYYTKSEDQISMPNSALGWERTSQFNIGVDFSVLKGRVSGTIDYYHSNTTDLLMKMNIPTLSGYPNTMANIGETKNNGIDITINATPVKIGDFEWNTSLNAAWQKDEIVELANGKEDDIANSWFIGESIGVFYGIDNAGLWQAEDADEMAKFNENGHNFTIGSVRPVDQNGDYKIDAENDRVILGNKNPRWTLGWTNTFSWKGLELTIDMWGRFKYMINTGGEGQYGMYQQREIDYWRPDNTGAEYQKPVYSTAGGDPYSSLLGFKDASFIKLRNLSLGYRFDKLITDKLKIEGLKVFVQGKNLGRIYSSVDFMDLDMGTTYYNRGVTFGVQVDF
ncbi:MAG: TonB-dependent receptor [Marinilabiliaceae bacterium]|nr:TonB-dependent receptor [Marinilabiliaceae bacterium]